MKKIIKLAVIIFFIGISFSIVHPVTTNYVNSLGLPSYYFGFFFAVMSFGQVVGAMFFSYLSSKVKKKIIIFIGILGYGINQLGFGFINSIPPLILVFRFFAGFFAGGANTLIIALGVQMFDEELRVKGLSILSSFSILGASLAYEIGGDLYSIFNFEIYQVFIFQVSFCVFAAILSQIILLNEEKEISKVNKVTKKLDFSGIKDIGVIALLFFLGLFLVNMGQIVISKYIDVIVIDLEYRASDLGHFTLIAGIVGCLTNLLITPLITKNKKINKVIVLIIVTCISSILSIITFNVYKDYLMVMLYSLFMVYTMLKAMIIPLEQNYLVSISKEENYTKMLGLRQSFISLGSIVGPLIGSAIYVSKNVLIFDVGSLFILLGGILFLSSYIVKNKKSLG